MDFFLNLKKHVVSKGQTYIGTSGSSKAGRGIHHSRHRPGSCIRGAAPFAVTWSYRREHLCCCCCSSSRLGKRSRRVHLPRRGCRGERPAGERQVVAAAAQWACRCGHCPLRRRILRLDWREPGCLVWSRLVVERRCRCSRHR